MCSIRMIRSGPGFCSNPRPPSSLRQDDAKADAPVVVLALHLVALRHRAVDRPVVEAAAALRDGPHVFDVRVLALPLDLPGHVLRAELVRRLPGGVLGVIAALRVAWHDPVDIVLAGESLPRGRFLAGCPLTPPSRRGRSL